MILYANIYDFQRELVLNISNKGRMIAELSSLKFLKKLNLSIA